MATTASTADFAVLLLAQATGSAGVAAWDWAGFAFRLLHILGAITLVGGTFYMRLVLVTSDQASTGPDDEQIGQERRRWARLVMLAAAALLVSGLYTMAIYSMRYKLPGIYLALFSIKFLLALFVFFIASALAGKTEMAQRFRQRTRFWLTVNMWAGVVIVVLAGVMRITPKPEKPPKVEAVHSAQVDSLGEIASGGLPSEHVGRLG